MFLKPKIKGQIIRDPKTRRPLKQEGEKVKKSTYWLRRLREGSVIEIKKAEAKVAFAKSIKKDGGK